MSDKTDLPWSYNRHSGGVRNRSDRLVAVCYGKPAGSGAHIAARIVKCVNQHDNLVATLAALLTRAESKEFGMDQSCTHDGTINCDAMAHARRALADADKKEEPL